MQDALPLSSTFQSAAAIGERRRHSLIETVRQLARRRPMAFAAAVLTLFAFALRSALFGDPVAGLDEQLYLLIGQRMWDGALPYVDLWDRKPFGLFLTFAAFSAGGHGLIVSQLVATLCAAATGWMVVAIVRRWTPLLPALLAGIVYIADLRILGGQTTQTPVFYDLFVASAALLVLKAGDAPRTVSAACKVALAMTLCGLAIQFKPTAALEGVVLGMAALIRFRTAGLTWRALISRATLYAALGLAPSLAATAYYAAIGRFDAYWFANVVSIFARGQTAGSDARDVLMGSIAAILPVAALAALGMAKALKDDQQRRDLWLLLAWAAATLVEFVMLGCYWSHYLMPFLTVASIGVAFFLQRSARPILLAAILTAGPVFISVALDPYFARHDEAQNDAMAAAMPAAVRDRCLFIYEGNPNLYQKTHACTVTRFVFTDHLRSSREENALGVDSHIAMREALAKAPAAIVTVRNSDWMLRNVENDALLADALRRHYVLRGEFPHVGFWKDLTVPQLWVRRTASDHTVNNISSVPA